MRLPARLKRTTRLHELAFISPRGRDSAAATAVVTAPFARLPDYRLTAEATTADGVQMYQDILESPPLKWHPAHWKPSISITRFTARFAK